MLHNKSTYDKISQNSSIYYQSDKKYTKFESIYKAIASKLNLNNFSSNTSISSNLANINATQRNTKCNKDLDNTMSVYDRLYTSNTKNTKEYVIQLNREKLDKEDQASFYPQTNVSITSQKRRSMNEFIRDMDNFNQAKKSKIFELIQQKKIEEDKSLNSYFRDRSSRSPDFSTINKLYETGRQKQLQRSMSPNIWEVSKLASPAINKRSKQLSREGNVSDILYNDALARRNK